MQALLRRYAGETFLTSRKEETEVALQTCIFQPQGALRFARPDLELDTKYPVGSCQTSGRTVESLKADESKWTYQRRTTMIGKDGFGGADRMGLRQMKQNP